MTVIWMGIVLAAVLIVAAFSAESSPARTTSATGHSASTTKVVSKKYGYKLVLAGPWFAHYAVTQWLGGFPFGSGPDVDMIFDARDRKFIMAAKPLPAGTTLPTWTTSHLATLESFTDGATAQPMCQKARAFRNTTLGGAPAREFVTRCGDPGGGLGYDVIVLTAIHRGRGYIFQFLSPPANSAASDRRIYDAGRRSFRFAAQ